MAEPTSQSRHGVDSKLALTSYLCIQSGSSVSVIDKTKTFKLVHSMLTHTHTHKLF